MSFCEQRAVACTRVRTITNRSGLLLDCPSPPLFWFTSHRYVAGLSLVHQPSSEFIRGARAAAVCIGESARGVGFFFLLPVLKDRDQAVFLCARLSSSLRRTTSLKVTFSLDGPFAKHNERLQLPVLHSEKAPTVSRALFSSPSPHRSRSNVN